MTKEEKLISTNALVVRSENDRSIFYYNNANGYFEPHPIHASHYKNLAGAQKIREHVMNIRRKGDKVTIIPYKKAALVFDLLEYELHENNGIIVEVLMKTGDSFFINTRFGTPNYNKVFNSNPDKGGELIDPKQQEEILFAWEDYKKMWLHDFGTDITSTIQDKQKFLDEHWGKLKLTDKKICIHCDQIITVGEYKVFKDDEGKEWIYCPNSPKKCNGTVIDWFAPPSDPNYFKK